MHHPVQHSGNHFEDNVSRVVKELAESGFGDVSELSVGEKLKRRLSAAFARYAVFGGTTSPFPSDVRAGASKANKEQPCGILVYQDHEGQTGAVPVFLLDADK